MPKILELNIKIQEIQNRLTKDSYLSREYLPSSIDAKIFLTLQQEDKMPNRQLYPNFFHWYIMMRQFAKRTIQIWLQKDQNHYAEDFLLGKGEIQRKNSFQLQNNETNISWNLNLLNNISACVVQQKNQQDQSEDETNRKISLNKISAQAIFDLYYIMDIKIKSQNNFSLEALKEKFISQISLRNQKYKPCYHRIQIIDMKQIDQQTKITSQIMIVQQKKIQQENNQTSELLENIRRSNSMEIKTVNPKEIRIVFKVDKEQSELLKDKVLNWPEVENIKFKKQKRERKVLI